VQRQWKFLLMIFISKHFIVLNFKLFCLHVIESGQFVTKLLISTFLPWDLRTVFYLI
jgi:antibiotic biosynthesis monooxygenase (ABM) superfamily enzyme